MEIVVDIGLESRIGFEDVFQRVCILCCNFSRSIALARNNEGHDIFGFDMLAFCQLTKRDLHGRHGISVWVFCWCFTQLREDCVGLHWDLVFTHAGGELTEVFVDIFDDRVGFVAGEQKAKEFPSRIISIVDNW